MMILKNDDFSDTVTSSAIDRMVPLICPYSFCRSPSTVNLHSCPTASLALSWALTYISTCIPDLLLMEPILLPYWSYTPSFRTMSR